jgi:(R,R)-butanediol dehydrogenase/meso-butanediol dehydrogenase/diacetyl reductase
MIGRDRLAQPHGGFAPRIAIDAARLVRVDLALTDDEAAVVEPTTVALHAVLRSRPRAGEVVVVQGCGPIGLLTLQCALALDAAAVIAVEPDAKRRELALSLGADEALSPADAAARFGRAGADLVFECAGVPSTVQQAVDLVRRGGRVNLVGLASGTATIAPGSWLVKEVSVVASLGYLHHEFGEAIALIADGSVQVAPLHDRTVTLAELPAAIAELADDPSSAIKVLVDVTDRT